MTRSPSPIRIPLLGWEIVYYALLAVIFTVAIHLRVQLPPVPFLDWDSWDYLQPAITPFVQGTEIPTYREFFYPWLLKQMLWGCPNFSIIIIVQHSVGILAAILILLTWHRMRIFLPLGMTVDVLHRAGGLILTALYLFAQISVLDEHKIRPEAFLELAIALSLWVATEFSRRTFLKQRFGMREGALGVLLIFLSSVAYYLRPYYGIGVLCALLPLFVALVMIPGNRMIKGGSLVCSVALVFVLLVCPDRQVHSLHKFSGNDYYLAETLFCSSAEMVYDLLQKDAHTLPADDPKRPIAENMLQYMNMVIGHPSNHYAGYTRFDPDDVRYYGPMGNLKRDLQWDGKQVKDFCYSYYFRAWEQYPFRMFKKILDQLWFFYSPPRYRVYDPEKSLDASNELQRSKEVLQNEPSYSWTPFQNYKYQVLSLQGRNWVIKMPKLVLFMGRIMNALYSVSLLLTLIATVALQLGWLKETRNTLKYTGFWALYLFSYNFGMSLTIALVHVMGQRRYTFGQTLFSALSECFALVFLFSLIPALLPLLKICNSWSLKKP